MITAEKNKLSIFEQKWDKLFYYLHTTIDDYESI